MVKASLDTLGGFDDGDCWVILDKLVGDSLAWLPRRLLEIVIILLSVSETGVVAASQSFPPNELFKLMFATSLSLQVFELLELEFVLIVLGC